MSLLERCLSYRESNKGSKERQGPTLGVRFTEVSVMRESTVSLERDDCRKLYILSRAAHGMFP